MANTHDTLSGLFTDIANAIREKSGGTEPIVADNFPQAISEISTSNPRYGNGIGQISSYELVMFGQFSPYYVSDVRGI